MTQQNSQHPKFEYKEFGDSRERHFVVPTPASPIVLDKTADEKDELIKEIQSVIASDAAGAYNAENIANIPNDTPNIHDIAAFTAPEEKPVPIAPVIDIEAIKMESYRRGYDDAKATLEPELKRVKEDDAFHSLLKTKLESISPVLDLQDQTFKLVSNLLNVIAKKLHLMVPADFESLILGEMVPLLSKYYKIGMITLNVNPERVDYCKNLFRIGSLPNNISENITVIADESMARDSCKMEWNDALLEYNQEELITDIEKILEHLKIEVNN